MGWCTRDPVTLEAHYSEFVIFKILIGILIPIILNNTLWGSQTHLVQWPNILFGGPGVDINDQSTI